MNFSKINSVLKQQLLTQPTLKKLRRQSVRTQSSFTLKHRATLLFQFPTLKRLQSLPMQTAHFCRLTTHLLLRSTKDRLNSVQTLPLKALQSTSTVTAMQWEVQSSAKKNTSTLSVLSRRITSAQHSAQSMRG